MCNGEPAGSGGRSLHSLSGPFLHEACLYDTNEELLSLTVPFARESVAAGEPIVFALSERSAALLRPELASTAGVTFVPGTYEQPANAVRALKELFDARPARGGGRVRLVGEILASTPLEWEPWARYEAAGNRIFADYDAWAVCLYDRRTTPAAVLADVARTHPRVATGDQRLRPNERFEVPEAFLRGRLAPPADPIERRAPEVELIDPMPAAARRAVAELARRTRIRQPAVSDFVLGISEAVTNAHLHGRPPAVLRLWMTHERLHATVSDTGPGPADPLAGLRPSPRSDREQAGLGLGLWMAHQLCGRVTHATDPRQGFTIRLTTDA